MLVLELLVAAAIVGTAVLVARGRGSVLATAPPDSHGVGIGATGPLDPRDVDDLRFGLAFRGYRMAEVDFVLGRLAGELRRRDEELARLRPAPAAPSLADARAPGTEHSDG